MSARSVAAQMRPNKFDEVIGNEAIVHRFRDASEEQVPPVLLFHGPSGTGKTTLARLIAKLLVSDVKMNVIERNCADQNGVDDVRQLIDMAKFSPMGGGNRLVILDEAHMLTVEAQTALLKMLEEPKPYQYFILCTTDQERLLATVRGRAEVYETSALSEDQLRSLCQRAVDQKLVNPVPGPIIDRIVQQVDGSARVALMKLEQVSGVTEGDAMHILRSGATEKPDDPGDVVALAVQNLARMPEEVKTAAMERLKSPALMETIRKDLDKAGLVGEGELGLALYVVGVSRLLRKPIAAIVRGASAAGKSYAINTVAKLFPEEAIVQAHEFTPKALYYLPAGSLVHRWVVAGERARGRTHRDPGSTKAFRELVSDGQLSKWTPQGQLRQPGPIAYVESTTMPAEDIFAEDFNRALTLTVDESAKQTCRIIAADAAKRSARDAADEECVLPVHFALQRYLRPVPIHDPKAAHYAQQIPSARVEARRAWGLLTAAADAIALLHQYQRPREGDGIVVQPSDWQWAWRLFGGAVHRLLSDAPPAAAKRLWAIRAELSDRFTVSEAEERLRRAAVRDGEEDYQRRAVQLALKWLVGHQAVEQVSISRGRRPAEFRLVPDVEELDQDQFELMPPPARRWMRGDGRNSSATVVNARAAFCRIRSCAIAV